MVKGISTPRLVACLGSVVALSSSAVAADGPDPTPAPAPAGTTVGELVVTASRLNAARASIQPALGASVYTIDSKAIAALPGGDNLQLNQVVLQSPGVAQDSFGQLHVRGEHNGLQYRLRRRDPARGTERVRPGASIRASPTRSN